MDELFLRFSRFFIKHRFVNLVIIGTLTLFFGYKALQLQVFSQFIDLLPYSVCSSSLPSCSKFACVSSNRFLLT